MDPVGQCNCLKSSAAAVAAAAAADDDNSLLHSIRRRCCSDNKNIPVANLLTKDPRARGFTLQAQVRGPRCNVNRIIGGGDFPCCRYYQSKTDRTIKLAILVFPASAKTSRDSESQHYVPLPTPCYVLRQETVSDMKFCSLLSSQANDIFLACVKSNPFHCSLADVTACPSPCPSQPARNVTR